MKRSSILVLSEMVFPNTDLVNAYWSTASVFPLTTMKTITMLPNKYYTYIFNYTSRSSNCIRRISAQYHQTWYPFHDYQTSFHLRVCILHSVGGIALFLKWHLWLTGVRFFGLAQSYDMQRFPDILEVLRVLHIDHKHHLFYTVYGHTKRAGVYHFYHFYFTISYVFLSFFFFFCMCWSLSLFQHFQLCICKQGAIRLSSVLCMQIKSMNGHFIWMTVALVIRCRTLKFDVEVLRWFRVSSFLPPTQVPVDNQKRWM